MSYLCDAKSLAMDVEILAHAMRRGHVEHLRFHLGDTEISLSMVPERPAGLEAETMEALQRNMASLLERLDAKDADLEALRATKACGCGPDEGCDECCPLPGGIGDSEEAAHCLPPGQLDEAIDGAAELHRQAYTCEGETITMRAALVRKVLRLLVHHRHQLTHDADCPNCPADEPSNDESPAVAEVISVAYRDIACSGGDHGVAILDNPDHIKHFEVHQEVELRREGAHVDTLTVTQVDRERGFIRFEPGHYIERADRLRVGRRVR